MVAMSIFTLVIAGGIAGIQKGYGVIDNARHYTRLGQIVQSEIESLRSLSWKELGKLPASEEIDVDNQFDTSVYDDYTVRRTITDEESDLKRVRVAVSFTSREGRAIKLSHVTFFTEGGVNDYYYRTL